MKTITDGLTPRAAVACGALIAVVLVAHADRAAAQAADQTARPVSTVEVGPGGVGQASYKAGEYNGLQDKGPLFIGNVDLRGRVLFNSESAFRWRIRGSDLGLDTRSVSAEAGAQGRYRVTFGYSELRRNRSDSYQTPYDGAGTNMLTLPSGWLVPTVAGSSGSSPAVNTTSARGLVPSIGTAPYILTSTNSSAMGSVIAPTATQIALVSAAAAADVPLFHTVNLDTTRTRFDAAFNYSFDERWAFDASFRPEHRDGLKPMGTVSRNTGGDISTIIPDRIDTNTNQINLSLNFTGDRTFAQAVYYGSLFSNNVPLMSWQNWATSTGTLNTISSTPDNAYHQFSVTGSHKLSPTARLVANASYARNTQNDAFLTDSTTPIVPVTSLNGLVVSTAFDAKFTARPAKKMDVAAAYKYDDRNNRTAVNIFQYADAGEPASASASFPAGPNNPYGAVVAQNANANRPYSRTLNQATLEAGYAIANGQRISAGYQFQRVNRECPGSWISCADAAVTNEHTLRAEWRASVDGNLTGRIGYERSQRRTPDYNENAFLAVVPYAGVVPSGQSISALDAMIQNGLTGYGPVLGYNGGVFVNGTFFSNNNALANGLYANGNRISELVGMRRYYVADRDRDKVRTALNWQATDAFSVQGGVDFNRDDYPDSTYGLQHAKTWAANLDGSVALSDKVSADVFYSYENLNSGGAGNSYTANSNAGTITNSQPGVVGLSGNACDGYTTLQQRNNNNKVDPCLNWFTDMRDIVHTVGFSLLGKDVGSPNLELAGNLIVSRARSDNNVSGGNWANNLLSGPGAAPTSIAAYFIPATALPTVPTTTTEVRVDGKYSMGKGRLLRAAYTYLRMRSGDWAYEGMQMGSLSGVLPTNEQPFNYGVNVFGVSYVITF